MRLASPLGILVLIAALMAGCHGTLEDDPQPEWVLRGTFTGNATQEDLDDLRVRLEPFQAQLFVLESIPMQFRIEGPVREDCPAAYEMLRDLPYSDMVGDCEAVAEGPDDSDTPGTD